MKVAIVHDFLNQRGGAERSVVAMARLFPDAPIFTSMYDPDGTFDEFRSMDIRTSFMQKLPHTEKTFRALLPLYPLAFRNFDLSGFDLVISSSTHWAHHVDARGAFHVVYCYNPPRWIYQMHDYLDEGGPLPGWAKKPLKPVLGRFKALDKKAAARPDAYVAISQLVSSRIWTHYGRKARVVHPPVDTKRFAKLWDGDHRTGAQPTMKGGDHYLVVSRLLGYKRVDLAVQVCGERGAPLVVVGDGPARADLERMAGPNVRFAGRVGDDELLDLYGRARALIHAGQEDFGLVPLEANAAGIPSVCFRNGGALETVVPGVTGILFPEQRGGMLNAAIDELESRTWDTSVLKRHAEGFSEQAFQLALLEAIDSAVDAAFTSHGGMA
ncbi:MAG: glycosyltransferase [Actinomycetota bacterium]|nr:glycosyltransferase [Actinomycetota bacterium]